MGSRQRPASCGSGPRGRIRTRPMMRPSARGAPANARGARAMCGAALALPAVRATPAEPLRGRLHGGTCASAGRGAPLRPHPPMRGRGSSRPRHRPPSRRHTPDAARNSKREPTSEAVPRCRQAAPGRLTRLHGIVHSGSPAVPARAGAFALSAAGSDDRGGPSVRAAASDRPLRAGCPPVL